MGVELRVSVTHTRESVTPLRDDATLSKNISFDKITLSDKYLARKAAFLRLAGEAIAKRGSDFNDSPYYGGIDDFEIKPRPSQEPSKPSDSKRVPGGPGLWTQQWERTNKRSVRKDKS